MLSKMTKELVKLSHDEVCLILENLDIQQSVNLGATLIHKGQHQGIGLMLLVSDMTGGGAYARL